MERKKMSGVWGYFTKVDDDRDVAICNICQRALACKRSCTSGLKKHLENIHKIRIENFKRERTESETELLFSENTKVLKIEETTLESEIQAEEQYLDYEIVYDENDITDQVIEHIQEIETKPIQIQEVPKVEKFKLKNETLWNHFKPLTKTAATCLKCNKPVLYREETMKGLLVHYNTHLMNESREEENVSTKFENSVPKTIAKLFAIEDISIKTLSTNEFFKTVLKNSEEIENILRIFYERSKLETIYKISEILDSSDSTRLSLLLDNSLGLRYLKVSITANTKIFTLGAIKNDKNLLQSLIKKLKEFDIDFNQQIVASTIPNSLSVSIPNKQHCYSNALHLAVSDVLYERHNFPAISSDSSSDSESEFEVYSHTSNFNQNIQKNIEEVRRVIKIFKAHDSDYNDALQTICIQKIGEEVPLVLNSKTKWNTIEPMLKGFIKAYDCICSALSEMNEPEPNVKIDVLKDIYESLKPITLSMAAYNRPDANLLTAEVITEFLLESLSEKNLPYCFAFKEAIKRRMKDCENKDVVELMKYLHNGIEPTSSKIRDKFTKTAHDFINRMWFEDEGKYATSNNQSNLKDESETSDNDEMDPLEKKLNATINNLTRRSVSKPEAVTRFQKIQADLYAFEGSGKLSTDLSNLLGALSTIKPSCTHQERAFKVPSHLCPLRKYNNNLEFLDMKIFLKGFFEN